MRTFRVLTLMLFFIAAVGCGGDETVAGAVVLPPQGTGGGGGAVDASAPSDGAAVPDGGGAADPDGVASPDTPPDTGEEGDVGSPPAPDAADDAAGGEDAQAAPDAEAGDTLAPGDAEPAPDGGSPDAAAVCPPGVAGCANGQRLVCNATGTAFELSTCPDGAVCADGVCVECVADAHCAPGEACVGGQCTIPPLTILTQLLPTGLVGAPYAAQLLASGGTPPVTWALENPEALSPGLTLHTDGTLTGAPLLEGVVSLQVVATDGSQATATATLTLEVVAGDLTITTPSPLPKATEGEPYQVSLAAAGGTAPYFFGALDPLPPGLGMGADGVISGTPTTEGNFSFTLKAFDNGAPTLTATRAFELPVGLAPLVIIGDQEADLFVTKLITLPLIVVVQGIPIPYVTNLKAKGGKKPYHWTETPLNDLVLALVPNGGLPEGLNLADDGTLSGAVTDPTLIVTVEIPFTQIKLSGFFFQARVTDSQASPESAEAMFIVPTVPPQ